MRADVILHHLVIDVLHAEEQCLRLGKAVAFPPLTGMDTGIMGDIAIGRAIDDDLGTNAPQPTLAGANNTEHPGIVRIMVIDDGIDDHGVQQ